MAMKADALIVGGGPVGLALAIGLHQQGLKVLVLEKSRTIGKDWSSAYTYRVDTRGIACFRELGIFSHLEEVAVPNSSFDANVWMPDGSITFKKSVAAVALGYWITRPTLLRLLEAQLPADTVIDGEVQALELGATGAVATVRMNGAAAATTVEASVVFGCEGARSIVRETLAAQGGQAAEDFAQHVLESPSSGLVYKAVLVTPPKEFQPSQFYVAKGKSGRKLTFLPFAGGKPGEPRPLAHSGPAGSVLHSFQTSEALYNELREDFPQLNADESLDKEAAEALVASSGSTFPRPRWCRKAAGERAALLGDSLHCFPPDLGQGVNAGLCDVSVLLAKAKAYNELQEPTNAIRDWPRILAAYDESQAPEAEAICNLLPIGMPYQYGQPDFWGKVSFFSRFMVRALAWKIAPWFISAPVVFLVTSAPALRYTEVWEKHRVNTRRLMLVGVGALVATVFLAKRRLRS